MRHHLPCSVRREYHDRNLTAIPLAGSAIGFLSGFTSFQESVWRIRLPLIGILIWLLATSSVLAHPRGEEASPVATTTTLSVQLIAVQDIGVIESAPNVSAGGYPYFVLNVRPGGDYDYNFIGFDLSVLPADATIDNAELQLHVDAFGGPPLNVEIGKVEGAWDESINWNSKPAVAWSGQGTSVSGVGQASWPLTQLVSAWQNGSTDNHGVALRGVNSNGAGVRANTRDAAGVPPILAVTYTLEEDNQPRPDLGDAPDSSNHHNVVNTAYPAAGTVGRFPTVWDTPAGQPAGPRHLNQSMEGWLGQYLSREAEADQGPDQDGPNNILRSAGGVIADVADNDRGDDGWRNRDIKFFDCRQQTLTVRVSKSPNATRNRMYLNVWFDGNRDGDWADISPCRPDEDEPNQASYEWIVQDHVIDMTAIPAGGYLDFDVNTELIYNATPGMVHWMRFTLSESRAVESENDGYPDGRGPHPSASPASFEYGETEDIPQRPPSESDEPGELVLRKRVITDSDPVGYAGSVTYEISLKQEGGSGPMQAEIRDELPYPLHVNRQIDDDGNIYLIDVFSPTGGAAPLQAELAYNFDPNGTVTQVIEWQGTLDPDAEIRLSFEVHVHPLCGADEQTITLTNLAQARPRNGDAIQATAEFEAACPGYSARNIEISRSILSVDGDVLGGDIDSVQASTLRLPTSLIPGRSYRLRTQVTNHMEIGATLGWTGCLTCTLAADVETLASDRIESSSFLPTGETIQFERVFEVPAQGGETELTEQFRTVELPLGFCILQPDGQADSCPDPVLYPNLVGQAPPLEIQIRPSDLGDAPDSTNHFGVAMAAYPGQQGDFPTVFDPATGAIQGPIHRNPRPLHLGRRVSLEAEADIGPDQDPNHNIEPPANVANLDRGDDGIRPGQVVAALNVCQISTFQARVFIHPVLLAAMQEAGRENLYINSWIDANQNGNWADERPCPNGTAPEHIVIDFPVPLTSLVGGLNTVNVTTSGPVPWEGDTDTWLRIMLSEEVSVKLAGKSYGDGRGPANGYRTGETEDYRLYPVGGQGDGPDIALDLAVRYYEAVLPVDGVRSATDAAMNARVRQAVVTFKIDYENQGAQAANGALLEFQIPEKFREGDFNIQAPGISQSAIQRTPSKIAFGLPDLRAGGFGTIVLGWRGCLTCTVAANVSVMSDEAVVSATLDGDVDDSNNSASTTLGDPATAVRVFFKAPDGGAYLHRNALTCQNSLTTAGAGWGGERSLQVFVNGVQHGTAATEFNGTFEYPLMLEEGRNEIVFVPSDSVNSATKTAADMNQHSSWTLNVRKDSSLLLDPMSLRFVGPNGMVVMPDPGFLMQHNGSNLLLPASGAYDVQVSSCPQVDVASVDLLINDHFSRAQSADDCEPRGSDACGPWSARLAVPDTVGAASVGASSANTHALQIRATGDGTEEILAGTLGVAAAGIVRDATNGNALENATVALFHVSGDVGDEVPTLWASADAGQSNPQITVADGRYLFTGPADTVQLTVERDGYQPYTTERFVADGRLLTLDIALTPIVDGETDHVIELTGQGFVPTVLSVQPGSIVEFVNVDLANHGVAGAGRESGLLEAGESYRLKLENEGSFDFADGSAGAAMTIIVTDEMLEEGVKVFLPMASR